MLDGPIPILCAGITLEIILGLVLLRTGRGAVMAAMGVVALLTLAAIGIERFVVTDAKRVKGTIEGIRAAVEANDVSGALTFVAPEAQQLRRFAQQIPGRVRFTEVKVKDLKVTIDRTASPARAEAAFFAHAAFSGRDFPYGNYAADFVVELRRYDGQWLITKILDERPLGGGKVAPIDKRLP